MISAAFTVNGATNPAAHSVAYASDVDLELLSYVGATSITWSIVGCSDPDEPIPTITTSGTPPGRTASFTMPVDSGDGYGRTFLVKCIVSSELLGSNGARQESVEYAVVGAPNLRSLLPIVPGEENYRNGTHGWAPEINIALRNTASGSSSGDVVGPISSVNGDIVIFNGTGGDAISDSGIKPSDLIHKDGSVAFTANQSVGGFKLTSLADGTVSTDAVTKGQMDIAIAAGVSGVNDFKQSVRAATTANITLSGAQTIDGVSIIAGDRVLVKNQTSSLQNGIYVADSGVWSRATDDDTSAEMTSGLFVLATEGSTNSINQGKTWVLTTPDPITIGSTGLTFSSINGVTAGNGLTGTATLSVLANGSTINVSASGIKVADGGITSTQLADASIDLAGAKVTGSLALASIESISALSVIGNNGTVSAAPASISGTADQVLRVDSSNSSLGFGQIATGGIANLAVTTAKIANGNVTLAKIVDGTGLSVVGRASNSSGVNADIVSGADGAILRQSGSSIGFGSIDLSLSATVGTSKLAITNISTSGATTGQALTFNGSTVVWGTDFGANTVKTTGILQLGSTVSAAGTVRTGTAFTIYGRSTGSSNVVLLDWGQATADQLRIGDSLFGTTIESSNSLTLNSAGNPRMTLGTQVSVYVSTFRFKSTVSSPVIQQESDSTNGVTAQALTVNAQDASSGSSGTGGAIIIRSGTGLTANGDVSIKRGATTVASWTNSSSDFVGLGSAPPSTGAIRLSNNLSIYARTTTSSDVQLLTLTSGDSFVLGNTSTQTIINGPAGVSAVRFLSNAAEVFRVGTQLTLFVNTLQWNVGEVNAIINQAVTGATSGAPMSVTAQGTTFIGGTGGSLTLTAGSSSGASGTRTGGAFVAGSGVGTTVDGDVSIKRGSVTVINHTTSGLALGSTGFNTFVDTGSSGNINLRTNGVIRQQQTSTYCSWVVPSLRFDETVAAPTFYQNDGTLTGVGAAMTIHAQDQTFATGGTTGGALTVRAGDATGSSGSRTGGALTLRSGTGATSAGDVLIQWGASIVFGVNTLGTYLDHPNSLIFRIGGSTKATIDTAVTSYLNDIQWIGTASAPRLTQVTSSIASGAAMSITAQGTTFNGGTGGSLTLTAGSSSGASGTRTGGDITIRSGTGASSVGNVTITAGTTVNVIKYVVSGSTVTVGAATAAMVFNASSSGYKWQISSSDALTYVGYTSGLNFVGTNSIQTGINVNDTPVMWFSERSSSANISLFASNPTWNSADGVLYIADRITSPTTDPSGGIYTYSAGGLFVVYNSSGVLTTF